LLAFWSEEGRRYQASQNIEVGNVDVDEANLTIAPGTTLSGHVTWEGKPSLDTDFLMVFLRGRIGAMVSANGPGYRQLAPLL
jgi:hypothetical protein